MDATIGQGFEVLATLAHRIPVWTKGLDKKRFQERVIKKPDLLAEHIRQIMAEMMAVNMITQRGADHLDPVKFLGQNCSFWKGPADGDGLSGERDHDSRMDTLREIDWSKVIPVTMLKENEQSIIGNEKYTRLREAANPTLGADDFLALWNNYQEVEDKDDAILEELYREKGITYIDFFGDILRDPSGDRYVLYLDRDGVGRWSWYCFWLDYRWYSRNFSASLQQV